MLDEPPDPPPATADADGLFELTAAPASLPRMRSWLRERLRRLCPVADREIVEDVELVCTELASNALEHADAPCRLSVGVESGEICARVSDCSPDCALTPGRSRLTTENRGRGLTIVAAVAKWGVHLHDRGKTVWACVPLLAAG